MKDLDYYTCKMTDILQQLLYKLWQPAIVMLVVTLLTSQAATAQGGPCNAHRWTAGDGWRYANGQWTVETLSAPSLQPKGIVRCASSAETETALESYAKPYNPAEFTINTSLTNCFDQGTETTGHTMSGPEAGEDIVWLNFDIRALAGSYQFQIVTNDNVGWALYHVDTDEAGPTGSSGTYPPAADGLSGNCANLVYTSCGISGSGWSTITVPAFKKPSNYYLAMWLLEPGTGPGKSTFTNNLIYKSRYGCGGATCTLEKTSEDALTCNTDNTYTVCADYAGSAGIWHLQDNAAIKATAYTVTTYAADGTTVVSTETSSNLSTNPIALALGTMESGAVFAKVCATYGSGNPYNIALAPDGNYNPGNDYVTCTDGGSFSGTGLTNPTVSAGSYGQMCVDGAAIALGGSPAGGTWTGAGVSQVEGVYIFDPAVAGAGSHTITYTYNATNGCGSQATATIVVNGLPNASAGNDKKITCTASTVVLDGSSATPGVTYMWSGPGGYNSSEASPTVGAAGTYTLTVTSTATGCRDTDTVVVTQDMEMPIARITASETARQDCDGIRTLTGSTDIENAEFSWTGPGGFTAATRAIEVSVAGTYILTVKDPDNGCTATAQEPVSFIPTPVANAGPDKVLTCKSPTVMLEGSSDVEGAVATTWTAIDGGHIVSGQGTYTPVVDAVGKYILQTRDPISSCVTVDTVEVTLNMEAPTVWVNINGSDAVITCANKEVTVHSGGFQPEGKVALWTGPNGFTSNQRPIYVSVPGVYTLTVTDTINGCSASDSIHIYQDINMPVADAGPDKVLSCTSTTVTLESDVKNSGVARIGYRWTALDGGNIVSEDYEKDAVVDAAGTYVLHVVNLENGCTDTDTVVVTRDTSVPGAYIHTHRIPVLKCGDEGITLSGISEVERALYSWTGPNGFTSEEKNIWATVGGEYFLTVTNPVNGCTSSTSEIVKAANQIPHVDAGPDKVLTCTTTSVTLEGKSDDTGAKPIGYVWSTEDGTVIGIRSQVVVDKPGIYTLLVVDLYGGCTATDIVVVTTDNQLPNISAQGGTLDCNTGTVQLMGSSTTEGVSYSWAGPMGYTSALQSPIVELAGDYTLTVTDINNGCSATMAVTVHPQPVVAKPQVTCYEINFENNNTGFITSTNTGAGTVNIFNRKRNIDGTYAPENHASIFNTLIPTGDDWDLFTEDWGHVLIINQDLNPEPNDNPWGGEMILDFSDIGPVTMTSLNALDFDVYEDNSWVYLYDGEGNELYKVQIHSLGNNSRQVIDLGNTKGVMKLKVVLDGFNSAGMLAGSGAIDGIKFCVETPAEDPCIRPLQTEMRASAFPMPFSDRTTVEFTSNEEQEYVVQLFDARGRMLRELQSGTMKAGEVITIEVDGTDLPNGMYMAHIVGKAGIRKTVKLINKK